MNSLVAMKWSVLQAAATVDIGKVKDKVVSTSDLNPVIWNVDPRILTVQLWAITEEIYNQEYYK